MPCSAPVSKTVWILKKSRLRMKFFTGWLGKENFTFGHDDVLALMELESLRDDADEAIGELRGDVVLDFSRERADDALQSFKRKSRNGR